MNVESHTYMNTDKPNYFGPNSPGPDFPKRDFTKTLHPQVRHRFLPVGVHREDVQGSRVALARPVLPHVLQR